MPTLFDDNGRQEASFGQIAQAHRNRILRYCSGKALAPSATTETRLTGKHESDRSSSVPHFGSVFGLRKNMEHHERLWAFDIKRLHLAAEASDIKHLQPAIEENDALRSWSIGVENLAQLGKVADQILYSLWLFSYEDEETLRGHGYPPLNPERGLNLYWKFRRIQGQIPDLPFNTRVEMGNSSKRNAKSDLNVTEKDQYCYIVDQITSILAHIACNSGGSSYWKVVILACLAKISTKLKAVAMDLPEAIGVVLHTNEAYWSDTEGKEFSSNAIKFPITAKYCAEYIAVSTWLAECMEQVLRNIGAQRILHEHHDRLDLCTLVYEAGTRGAHTQIYQDRWASISGSTNRLGIYWALTSLDVGSQLIDTLPPPSRGSSANGHERMKALQPIVDNETSMRTSAGLIGEQKIMIQATATLKNEKPVRYIRNIMEFVVVITPISIASPLLGKGFAKNLGAISSRADIHWEIPQKIELHNAFSSIRQVENPIDSSLPPERSDKIPAMRNDETSSLAQSWLVNHRYGLLRRDHSSSSSSPQQLNFDPPNVPHPQAQIERERLKTITDEWVTQETSIVIKYPEYVNTVFGLTVILVVGGVLCGLLVGSRVDGVDPFNFTVFSWILGGFILLVAKIVRVSDWTWRDFLLRRVTCRSVCELANVTELNEQEILAHLLSSESHSILQTGGPFQKVFAKYPVADGLSIDVCPDLQTLVASGIVPVKVVTVDGEALVLLHLIPGRESVRDIPFSGSTDSMLVCTRLPQSSVDSEDLVFNWQELSWTKVLGVYNAVEKRVR